MGFYEVNYNYDNIDVSITYDYRELPDKNSGQCDNCGKSRKPEV